MAASAIPIPAPPDVQPPQQAQPTMADQMGQMRANPTQMNAQATQDLQVKVQTLQQALMDVVKIAQVLNPSMMGNLAKMAQIGSAVDQDVQELVQRQQGNQGATSPQGPMAPSPTDASAAT